MHSLILTLLFCCGLPCLLHSVLIAQVPREVKFGVLDVSKISGSKQHIEKVIQDKFGFFWFDARGGIDRFDGYEIEKNQIDDFRFETYLSRSLEMDPNGFFWNFTNRENFFQQLKIFDPYQKKNLGFIRLST